MYIDAYKNNEYSLLYIKNIKKKVFKYLSKDKKASPYLFYLYYSKKFIISKETVFYLKNINIYRHLYSRTFHMNDLKKNLSYY
jgi:hypothetical protein